VSQAAYRGDFQFRVFGHKGLIGAIAITLQVTAKGAMEGVACVDEDIFKAIVSPAVVPIEENSVLGVMVDPEITLGGFSVAGIKATDGRFIHFEIVARTHEFCDSLVKWPHHLGEVVVPRTHQVPAQLDAVGGAQFPFLTEEGLVVTKLFGKQMGAERWGEHAAGQ
jgi:hypothetical protein